MPSQNENSVADEDDDTSSMPPPSVPATPRQGKSRKSARSSADNVVEEQEPSTAKIPTARKSTSRQPRQSDTETDADSSKATSTTSRKSEARRKIKHESPERSSARPPMPESAFSDENPFQSGSSPPTVEAPRRKSAGPTSEKRKNTSSRRKTEGATADVSTSTSRSIHMPVSSLAVAKQEVEHTLEPGEEFTPEEQTALATEAETSRGRVALTRRRKQQSTSKVPRSAPWVVLGSLIVGCATWYRQEKLAVGYCGVGRVTDNQWPVQIPEWAEFLQPSCEPCPQHATCYENLEAVCHPDFVLVQHPLSLGGLVPVTPSCEPDGEKARKVKAVADRAVETLRQRRADAECGVTSEDTGVTVPAEILEKDLKKEVSKNKRKGMGEDEFEELWRGAIGEIAGRDEVVTSQDG